MYVKLTSFTGFDLSINKSNIILGENKNKQTKKFVSEYFSKTAQNTHWTKHRSAEPMFLCSTDYVCPVMDLLWVLIPIAEENILKGSHG